PLADEVDGLRRALGDGALGTIPAHVTLVPPLNLRPSDLPAALARLRQAAATVGGPLRLTLGAVATFLPVNPVLYLPVGGDLHPLRTLRDAVLRPPLERQSPWPWVPHVTLADEAPEERIAAAVTALDHYSGVADLDRLVLLEQRAPAEPAGAGGPPGRPRRWLPLADAALGSPAVVGRGGLEVTLTAGRVAGPDLLAVAAAAGASWPAVPGGPPAGPIWPPRVVLTAEREGRCVGGAVAWWEAGRPEVAVLVEPAARRGGVGGHLLAALESRLRSAGWEAPLLHGHGPAGFYAARSRWTVPAADR
ncbi:MAG TPA: GNAT family N-acetyltransferase, partial [Acidimicrobiales bacterium]|nr:GNAT family N-acetyltransferase [Acidimicrobiales bacterium]